VLSTSLRGVKLATTGLLLAAIIVGGGIVYIVVYGHTGNNSTSAISSLASSGGLQLNASINATSITSNQRLGIAVSLYNTLSTTLNVSYTGSIKQGILIPNGWKVAGFPIAMWGSCIQYQPVEFMLVKGNYDLSAIQTASNASVFPRAWEGCYGGTSNVEFFVFQPDSSNATLGGMECGINCSSNLTLGSYRLTSNFTADGYWGLPLNGSESRDVLTPVEPCALPQTCTSQVSYQFPEVGPTAQHSFTPGVYTLIVNDEWGQAVVLHFTVS
jgi:hypothetical protein